jgi:hypothetical protein
MDSILAKYQKEWDDAKAANEARYQQGMQILDQAIQRYQPGGDFGKGAISQYNIGKTQAMSQGMSSLIGSGLSNTTVAAGMPIKYEQEVGTPFRLQLEDMRMQNLTQAEQAKTSFIQDREDMYPDLNMMAQLAMQAEQAEQGQTHTTSLGIGKLSKFGENTTDPGVSARNQAAKIEQDARAQQTALQNQQAKDRLSAARQAASTTGKNTKSMTTSDEEFKALLAKNMGTSSGTTTKTATTAPKSTTSAGRPANDPGYWDLGYMLGY